MTLVIYNDPVQHEDTRVGSTSRFPVDTFTSSHGYVPPVSPQLGPARPAVSTSPASAQRTYFDEKASFESLLPTLRWRHPGQYVAVAGGHVVAIASSRKDVTRQYFQGQMNGPVYIGFVGPRRAVRIFSPFRKRPNASGL